MQKQTINQKDPEKVFILCKNISGSTQSAGAALYFDASDTTAGADGYAVSGSGTGKKFLFAGINAQSLADDAKGLVQCYGIGSAYVVVTTSMSIGDQLDGTNSATHLVNFVPVSATSLVPVVSTPWNFVVAMSAVASGISTATLEPVFIRAL